MPNDFHQITFLRHGESVGNAEKRFQGQADFPLTENGRDQAQRLAERWQAAGARFELAVTSPLQRARQTAEIVCHILQVPLEEDPDWKEIDNGLLAGLEESEAEKVAPRPAFMTPYTHFGHTGESRWELYLRAGRNIQKLLERPAGHLLIVAHGGVLNMAMYAMLGIPVQADSSGPRFLFNNTTFATLRYEPEHHNWRLLTFNPWLPAEQGTWSWGG
jgi:2,3-bisphosphoglycerate-dependent phosphoglycerate mutase